ncbi:unnamed protein product [Brassicogethes aeneus]|uniref:Fibronectin type-III domain-containing protein n=1 Tax=Brassicogethes aeneus TaxID=1431903 RepID=A0A9P0AW79_BRAAE|nr:unnamed protein product [Brassicogethes aeneus]
MNNSKWWLLFAMIIIGIGKALSLKTPSQPWMLFAECHEKDVTVMFQAKNGSHIRNFLIQYNTSYNKDEWLDVDLEVPSNATQVKLPLIPGVEQSFQVIAENRFGRSFPSEVSNPCKGKPEVPHKNPSNVTAEVDNSGNLVIQWIPLKQIYHNAPLLMYRVYFACNGERKHVYTVNDWRVGRMVYPGQSKLHNCEVLVSSLNSIGHSDAEPEKIMSENDATKRLDRNYVPDFTWEYVKRYERNCTIVVKTIPSELDWKYTAFYLKYRKKFQSDFTRTASESINGNLTITGLENNALYDITLVVVSKDRNRYSKVQVISTYENTSYTSSGPILKKPIVTINTTITTSNSTENKKENVKSIDTQEAKNDAFWKTCFIVFTVISFSSFTIIITGIFYSRRWASFFLGFVDVESDGNYQNYSIEHLSRIENGQRDLTRPE